MSVVLYHGTQRRFVSRILRQGIKPSFSRGEWMGESSSEGVYLTKWIETAADWAGQGWCMDHHHDADEFERYGGKAMRIQQESKNVYCPSRDRELL